MIGISKLYCGTVEASDPLRYGRHSGRLPSDLLQFSADKRPVIVWNCTRRCNLSCMHCYSASDNRQADDELTTAEAKTMIDDLAAFGCPVLLFSGGEPLLRDDVMELIGYARRKKMRAVLSTNGTAITPAVAEQLAGIDLNYAGISLDGASAEINDKFRGCDGAFEKALAGIRHCLVAGVKVGLRFTINRQNARDIGAIFDLIERENIPRVCFYHLVAAGRGGQIAREQLSASQTRDVVDQILTRTRRLHEAGRPVEVLTVDNHADGPYLYMKLLRENPARAEDVYKLLRMNGGNNSGVGIGCISWDGSVHPDQFWRNQTLGNVRAKPFSEIWTDPATALLPQLRSRGDFLQGRCRQCKFLDICNGNLRARAEQASGNIWADDPACYLTDDEIK
ncbi:MAG: 12,18-didecarboxysiroheme deacetylase [Phycisphaerae bacterium]|nr:12,18-didecarboxysiroheme deacetylase [Phycisphaerae bacterium]